MLHSTMTRAAIAFASIAACLLAFGAATGVAQELQTEALLGFDPIELIDGREQLGRTDLTVEHEGLVYLFVNEANRDEFVGDPGRYGIQMGGLCARLGRTTGGDQELYTVYEGRIYVFASTECVRLFEEAPERYLQPGPPPALRETASAAALRRGAELIERAVAHMGGATALDGVRNVVDHLTVSRPTPDGDVRVPQTEIFDFAGERLRRDRATGTGTFVEIWVRGEGWRQGAYGYGAYSQAQAANLAKELVMPNPLYLLKRRGADGFIAASMRTAGAAGMEEVAVEGAGKRWRLAIDPASGAISSIAFVDRGPGGIWGELEYTFSDYRQVGAILWPFTRTVTFDGEPFPGRDSRTASLEVNAALAADLFIRAVDTGGQ